MYMYSFIKHSIIALGATNVYIDVNFTSPKSVVCTSIGPHQSIKSCNIQYGKCPKLLTKEAHNTVEGNTDSVQISLETELINGDCYSVIASNDTFVILQQGLYSKCIRNIIRYITSSLLSIKVEPSCVIAHISTRSSLA